MAGGMIAVDTLMLILKARFKGAAQVKQLDSALEQIDKKAKKVDNSMQLIENGLMSFGLSVLFTGMAIKNLAQNMLTSLVTAFTTARDEGDFLSNKLLGVSAAFEFLKFSIFDAFANSEFFVPIIDFIINLINKVSQIIALRPGLATFIVLFLGFAIVLGAVLMVLGQLSLSILGIIGLFKLIKGLGIVSLLAKFASGVKVLALAVTTKLLVGLKAVLVVMGKIGLALLKFFISPIGIAILAIGVVVAGLFLLSQKLGGVGNAFKAVGIFILRVLASIADGIYNIVIIALNEVIKTINRVIRASNRFLGTNFKEIEFVTQGGSLGARVDAMRDELIAQAENGQQGSSTTNINVAGSLIDTQGLFALIEEFFNNQNQTQLGSPNTG